MYGLRACRWFLLIPIHSETWNILLSSNSMIIEAIEVLRECSSWPEAISFYKGRSNSRVIPPPKKKHPVIENDILKIFGDLDFVRIWQRPFSQNSAKRVRIWHRHLGRMSGRLLGSSKNHPQPEIFKKFLLPDFPGPRWEVPPDPFWKYSSPI